MLGAIVRFIVSAIVLLLVGYVVPGFAIAGFWNALLAAVVIAAIGWVVESLFGRHISPRSRGFVGFLVAAVVIYMAQYLVPTMRVSVLGALLSALVIGLVDLVVPTTVR